MNETELIKLIEYTLDAKMSIDEYVIRYSFYEIRIKYNLTEEETSVFLELLSNKLYYMGYKVYHTSDTYVLNNETKIVNKNELLVAIR